jgi:tetratricopeptide (TPR) repeat protein/MinD-like ATPase involved in chromosome partitioning or flagellar assembly
MFVSFYSYKGGVGRTQLLVNIASFLCYHKNKKVLLLEWDLEAPGLHYFFGKKNEDITREGLIEVLQKYMDLAQKSTKIQKESLPYFIEENIEKNLIVSKTGVGRVDLIPCVNYSKPDFIQTINDFNWREFTEVRDGNVYIDFLKTKLEEGEYDYVFIDSRTGVADYSGICNILLPDINVVSIAPTQQNFDGALKIIKAIDEHPYVTEGQRKPFILPILSRIDGQSEKSSQWIKKFETYFNFTLKKLISKDLEKYLEDIFRDIYIKDTVLFYNRELSIGENIIFNKEAESKSKVDASYQYQNIANFIGELTEDDIIDFRSRFDTETLENWGIGSSYIMNMIGHHTPKFLTAPPFNPPVFEGREADLETVHDKLFGGENSLLLISGQGGMGKTSFVAKYWIRYEAEYNYLAFLFVAEGIAEALMSMSKSLGLNFTTETLEERTTILIEAISELDKPCLLILDNVDNERDLENSILMLRKFQNCHILLTSRLTEFEGISNHSLVALKNEKALQVFKKNYTLLQESEMPLFYETYEAIGKNTLVLELLAKTLMHFNNKLKKRYSLQEMLNDLQNGLTQLSQSEAVTTAYQAKGTGFRNETPEAIILSMYDLTDLSEAETALLSVFAMLPAENIAFEELEKLLQDENLDQTLLALAKKGWIELNETDFKASPVVQEITRHKNAERLLEDSQRLINSLKEQLRSDNLHYENYKYATLYSRYAESIINVFTDEPYLVEAGEDMAMLCERSGHFYSIIGNLYKSLELFEKQISLFEQLHATYPSKTDFKNGLAIAYSKLGQTHSELGDLNKALQFFEKGFELNEQLYVDYSSNVGFKSSLAVSYSKLGDTHSELGNFEKALQFFEKCFELNEQLYADYSSNVGFKNGLAISYEKLGQTHSFLGNLEKALQFFEKYLELNEQLYADYPSNVFFKNCLAISCEKLGQTHSFLGSLKKALQLFEKYFELNEQLYADYPSNVGFKNGLALSYEKLGQTHSDLGNLDKALQFFEKRSQIGEELYTDYPSNVGFKNGLAISFYKLSEINIKLNQKPVAKKYMQEAERVFGELARDFPAYVQFKQYWEMAKDELARL